MNSSQTQAVNADRYAWLYGQDSVSSDLGDEEPERGPNPEVGQRREAAKKSRARLGSQWSIGTSDWIEEVYASPAARDPRGRSRPTYRFAPRSRHHVNTICVESGNELTAFLFLEILQSCGLVKRFKAQPFELNLKSDGIAGVPDFFFERYDGTQVVAEVKSSAYYTEERKKKAERFAEHLEPSHLKYVLWTTKEHMTTAVWHNVRQVNKEHLYAAETGAGERLATAIAGGLSTLGDLVREGHKQQLILSEVSKGRVHFDLTKPRDRSTLISLKPNPEHYAHIWNAAPAKRSLWLDLKRCE